MKKLWLTLGLTLMLMAGGGQGYQGFGTSPACGQPPPYYVPPPYNNPYYYPPPSNYYNYYSAPYSDPLSQFLYYVAPQIGREGGEYEEREHRGREGYEYRGRGREGFEHRGHGRGDD
ncbi:MAG: hypothetical protein WC450_12225 [Candidatus Omnitrophota bacterium]|jgi:hypothetical protein